MLLQLDHISKSYPGVAGGGEVFVLRDVTLSLDAGESLAIVGPSGSGKSTLLNIIGTLDRPSAGGVSLAGRDLTKLSDAELATLRNHEIGLVFQSHHLLPHLSVIENVLVPTLVNKQSNGAADHAKRLLDRVGLGDRVNHRPAQLSGGERQRVAVVRALINKPKLLLADEPTGALDHASATNLTKLLVELNREEGVTLITVTHAAEVAGMMKRSVELRDGMLITRG